MVLISLAIVLVFLGVFVLPKFRIIFQDFHTELPAITQLLLGCSDFLVQTWPVLLTVFVALASSAFRFSGGCCGAAISTSEFA